MLLGAAPMDFLDITDYDLLEEVVEDEAVVGSKLEVPNAGQQLTPECTGIVVHSLFGGQQQGDEVRVCWSEGACHVLRLGAGLVGVLSCKNRFRMAGGCTVTQQEPSTYKEGKHTRLSAIYGWKLT